MKNYTTPRVSRDGQWAYGYYTPPVRRKFGGFAIWLLCVVAAVSLALLFK